MNSELSNRGGVGGSSYMNNEQEEDSSQSYDSSYFLTLSNQTQEQIERMKILKAKYPTARQSYQISKKRAKKALTQIHGMQTGSSGFQEDQINDSNNDIGRQFQLTQNFQSPRSYLTRSTLSVAANPQSLQAEVQLQKSQLQQTSIPQFNTPLKGNSSSLINFQAVIKIQKKKLLPELREAQLFTTTSQNALYNHDLNNSNNGGNNNNNNNNSGLKSREGQTKSRMSKYRSLPNIEEFNKQSKINQSFNKKNEDKDGFQDKSSNNNNNPATQSLKNEQQDQSDTSFFNKTQQNSRQQQQSQQHQLSSFSENKKTKGNVSNRLLQQSTSTGFPKKQPQQQMHLTRQSINDINQRNLLNKLNYFASENMVHIQIPHLSNFNVEPLHKYDEEQLYDGDFTQLFTQTNKPRGFSKWTDNNGVYSWKDCIIESYNPSTNTFMIRWLGNNKIKEVTRLNLLLENEPQEKGDERFAKAKERREMMLFFLTMKNKIINEDMAGKGGQDKLNDREINMNVIQYPMERLKHILDLSLLWKQFINQEDLEETRELIIQGVLELYKYNVIKFNYQFHTVTSMEHFYQRYLPNFGEEEKRGQVAFMRNEWVLEEYTCVQENNNDKQDNLNSISNVILKPNTPGILTKNNDRNTTSSSPLNPPTKTLQDPLNKTTQSSLSASQQQQFFLHHSRSSSSVIKSVQFNIQRYSEELDLARENRQQALKKEKQRRESVFQPILTDEQIIQQTNLDQQATYLAQQVVLEMKITQSKEILSDRSYVDSICNRLATSSLVFTSDKKFELFNVVVPMLAQFVTCLRDIKIYKSLGNIQLLYKQQAMMAIKQLDKDFLRQVFKLERVVDKIDSALEELHREFIRHLQNNNIPENNSWKQRVSTSITNMTNCLLSSYLVQTVNDSITDGIKSLEKYYAVLPMPHCSVNLLNSLQPHSQEMLLKRSKARIALLFQLPREHQTALIDRIDHDEDTRLVTESDEVKQQANVLKFKQVSQNEGAVINEDSYEKQDTTSRNNNTNSYSKQQPFNYQQEQDDNLLTSSGWQCIKDAQIIYALYQQLAKDLSQDSYEQRYHNMKFLKPGQIPIQPMFMLKLTMLNDKTEEGKKHLKHVTKGTNLKHLDQHDGFLAAIYGREKFYNYQNVTFMDMFIDLAKRNQHEFDVSKPINMTKLRDHLVGHRFGWFHLNSFMIRVEPPLDEIEAAFKEIVMNPMKQLQKIQKLYFGSTQQKMNELNNNESNQTKQTQNTKENHPITDNLLFSAEVTEKYIASIKESHHNFLNDSLYPIYALITLLLSFEFYLLHAKNYEKFITAAIESANLERFEEVFQEMKKLQRDLHTFRAVLPDQFNLGVFIIDISEYKSAVVNEIINKDALIKKQLQASCVETLKKNEDLEQLIHSLLDAKPQTIDQYIKINLYLEGQEIVQQLQQIEFYILLSKKLFEQLESYQIKTDQQQFTDFLQQDSMLKGIILQKEQKEKKQLESKPRFKKMHLEKKNRLLDEIELCKREIMEFSEFRDIDQSFHNQTVAETLKGNIHSIEEKIKEIRYEEIHLNTGYDGKLDFDEFSERFEYYEEFWKFAAEWKYKKEQWLNKSVINSPLSQVDLKDIESTLQQGNKMIRQVEGFFVENDALFTPLVNVISAQLSQYEEIYDFLVLVSHESFKSEHWNLILDALYTDDLDRKKYIMSYQNVTLQDLIHDNIISIIDYIKSIAGQAENEFKVHESIKILENELKKIMFSTINYFGIHMITNSSDISAYMKVQMQIIQNMIKNKLYSRNDFAHKLIELEQQVVYSRKVVKLVGVMQNRFIKIIPIQNFQRYLSHIKDSVKELTRCREAYEALLKEMKQRGLPYLLDLFGTKDLEQNHHDRPPRYQEKEQIIVRLSPQAVSLLESLEKNIVSLDSIENSLFSVIKHIRQQNSRFTFFSDFSIMNLCECVYNTKEFSDTLRQAFKGIQSFHIVSASEKRDKKNKDNTNGKEIMIREEIEGEDADEEDGEDDQEKNIVKQLQEINRNSNITEELSKENQTQQSSQQLPAGSSQQSQNSSSLSTPLYGNQRYYHVQSMKNWYGETIQLSEPIQYSLQPYDDPPTFTILKDIEASSRAYIRNQVMQNLNKIAVHAYKYSVLWGMLASRQVMFQILYLINDVIFYHDLTLVLSAKDIPYEIKLQQMKQHIQLNLIEFTSTHAFAGKTHTIQKGHIQQYTQFILQILQHQEILEEFITSKEELIEGLGCYSYQVLPKFTLQMSSKKIENLHEIQKQSREYATSVLMENIDAGLIDQESAETFPNLSQNSPLLASFRGNDFDVCLVSMIYKKSYTYEITPPLRGFVITQTSRRIFHSFIQALYTNSGAILKGPQATGKSSHFETICILLAKPYFIWKFESDQSYNTVNQILTGVAAGGFWLHLKSLESCDLGVISMIGQVVFLIRKAIMNEQMLFQFSGKSYPVHHSYGIVCSFTDKFNTYDRKMNQLPKSLLENFRIINLIEPDVKPIINNYMILQGFVDDHSEYTNKFLGFLRFISGLYSNSFFLNENEFKEDQLDAYKEEAKAELIPLGNLISLKTILKILRLAFSYHADRKEDYHHSALNTLHAVVHNYFACLLSSHQSLIVQKSFSCFFGTNNHAFSNDNSLNVQSGLFDKELLAMQTDIQLFLDVFHLKKTPQMEKLAHNVFPLVLNKNTLIISGRAGKNKSFFIKMLGFLYFKAKKKDFFLNWLKVDSISPERLLGCFNSHGEWEEGVINQIITSMSTNSTNKRLLNTIKYLPRKQFCSYPANACGDNTNKNTATNIQPSGNEAKATKVQQQQQSLQQLSVPQAVQQFIQSSIHDYITEDDWLIIDASAQSNKFPHNQSIERLLVGFYNRSFHLSNQDILKVPGSTFCVFEMESLQSISPNYLANHILVHLNDDQFTLKEEFNAWLLRMKQKNSFFGKFEFAAKICFTFFFEEVIDAFEKMPQSSFRYLISKKAHLNNFLNYFEIFLNEIRKMEIATGEWEDETNKGPNVPRTNLWKAKFSSNSVFWADENSSVDPSPQKLIRKGTTRFKFSNSIVVDDQINENPTASDNNNEDDTPNNLHKSKNQLRTDSDLRLVCYLESIFVFCLTWSVGNILKNEKRTIFNELLQRSIELYLDFRVKYTRMRLNRDNYPFAVNLKALLNEFNTNIGQSSGPSQLNIFEYCFDTVRSEWVSWVSLSTEEYGVISGNFQSNNLDNREIIRLNPYAINIMENKISKEISSISIPDKALFVDTKPTKITKHFLQYFLAYSKPLFLISRAQNGLTTLIHQRSQALVEQFNYSSVFLSCTPTMTVRNFQKKIEANLVSSQPFLLSPPNKTNGIVIVDDFNLASQGISPVGAVRSFLEGCQWFSNDKNRFVKFLNIVLVCLYSHSGEQSANMFDQRYCNIPLSVIEKSMIFKMPNYDSFDLISIFSEYNSNASSGLFALQHKISDKQQSVISQVCSSTASLALLTMKKRYLLAEITATFGANLSMQKAIEVIRNLNYFIYEDSRQSSMNMNTERYAKSLIFLLNQYYAQEFIHNSCEMEHQANQVFPISPAKQFSQAPSLTHAFSISNDSSKEAKDNMNLLDFPEQMNAIENPKTSLIENLHEIEEIRKSSQVLSCFEKIALFTDILDDKLGLDKELILKSIRIEEMMKIKQNPQKPDPNRDDALENVQAEKHDSVEDQVKAKRLQNGQHNFLDFKEANSQSERAEELFQKRVMQIWHTPSRHVQLAFKSTFMQKANKPKTVEEISQETKFAKYLLDLENKIDKVTIDKSEVEGLPLQLMQRLVGIMVGHPQQQQQQENLNYFLLKRNEVLFFNENLFNEHHEITSQSEPTSNKNKLNEIIPEQKQPDFQSKQQDINPVIIENLLEPNDHSQNYMIKKQIKDDEQIYKFTFIGKKNQRKIVQFLISKITFYPSKDDLLYLFSTRENSLYTLYLHSVKLLHLLQLTRQSILIESLVTVEAAKQLLRFSSFVLQYEFIEFDPLKHHDHYLNNYHYNIHQNDKTSRFNLNNTKTTKTTTSDDLIDADVETLLTDKLLQAMDSIFTKNKPCVLFIDMSAMQQAHMQTQIYILETVNAIVKNNEIVSLLGKKQWDSLLEKWNLNKKYIGLSNYVIYQLLAFKLAKMLKIVLYYEPKPTKNDTQLDVIVSYAKMLTHFTKYTLFTPLEPVIPLNINQTPHNEPTNPIKSSSVITDLFGQFIQQSITTFHESLVNQLYSSDFEIQSIYADHMSSFKYSTVSQVKYDYFYTYHIIQAIIQERIYAVQNETVLFALRQLCEVKIKEYENEIEVAKETLKNTIATLEDCRDRLHEAQETISKEETIISALHEEEKNLSELLARALYNENTAKLAEKDLSEPIAKLNKIEDASYNEDIQIKKMTQTKQMNQYIMVFLVVFAEIIEFPEFTEQRLTQDILESSRKVAQYNPVLDTQDMDYYREVFENIFGSHQIYKKLMGNIKFISCSKQQNDLLNILNKSEGRQENSYLFSLSNNFNLIQRDIINIIELSVKYLRAIVEKRKIPQSSQDLDSQIKELKARRGDIEHSLREPRKTAYELPPRIANLSQEQTSLEGKIANKTKGIQMFQDNKIIVEDLYKEKLSRDSHSLTDWSKLNEISKSLTVNVLFILQYPNFIKNTISEVYKSIEGVKLQFTTPDLPELLLGKCGYYEMVQTRFPQNSTVIDRLSIIEFLQSKDIYYPPLVVDKTGIFETYMRAKAVSKGLTVIFENSSVGRGTYETLVTAIKLGHQVVICNFNDDLLRLITPIVDWKVQMVNEIAKHFALTGQQESPEKSAFGIFTKFRKPLDFHQTKNMVVHQDFRIFFLIEKLSFTFPAAFLKKVYSVNFDIEDEMSWKLTMNDMLIQQFHGDKKDEVLKEKIEAVQGREADITNLLTRIHTSLHENTTCEDLAIFDAMKEDLLNVENILRIQASIQQALPKRKTSMDDPAGEDDGQSSREEIPGSALNIIDQPMAVPLIIPNIIILQQSDDNNTNTNTSVDYHVNSSNINNLIRSSPQSQLHIQDTPSLTNISSRENPIDRTINNDTSSESSSEMSDVPSMISKSSCVSNKRRKFVLPKFHNKRESLVFNDDDLNEQEEALHEIAQRGFAHLDSNLAALANLYVPILDFLYGVKINWINLGKILGTIYTFSEEYIIMVIKQTSQKCIAEKNTLSLESEQIQTQNFSNRFCETVLYIISGIFREDHLILFNFQLAMMLQRGLAETDSNAFNEIQWKFFLTQRIDNLHMCDAFSESTFEAKWTAAYDKFKGIFHLADDILGPLLDKYKIDEQVEQVELQTADETVKANSQTNKAMNRFKNLVGNRDSSAMRNKQSPQPSARKTLIPGEQDLLGSGGRSNTSTNSNSHPYQIQVNPAINVQLSSPENSLKHIQVNLGDGRIIQKDDQDGQLVNKSFTNQLGVDQSPDRGVTAINKRDEAPRKSAYAANPDGFIPITLDIPQFDSNQNLGLSPIRPHSLAYIPQLRELPLSKQIQLGLTAYKQFLQIIPYMSDNSRLRIVVNSISDHFKDWKTYVNESVKIDKKNEDKIILFKEYPNNIQNKLSPQEAMLVAKYFRSDCILRFAQTYIRKCFKTVIKITHKTSMDQHVKNQWYKRPTLLFFNSMDKTIAESLQLKAARIQSESYLVRLNCGFIPIEQQCIELENAAGAGAWVLIENMESLAEREMSYLLRKINQELERPSTTSTFKIWVTIGLTLDVNNTNGTFKPLDFQCRSIECNSMMRNLAQTSWKIFLNDYTNIAQAVERLFNIEAQEYKVYHDQKRSLYRTGLQRSLQGSGVNVGSSSTKKVGLEKILLASKTGLGANNCYVHKYLKMRLALLNHSAIYNFGSLLNPDLFMAQFPEYHELNTKFSQKYRFSLAFVLEQSKMQIAHNITSAVSHHMPFVTEFDIYYLLDDILNFLEQYPLNPKTFLEKYLDFLFPFNNHYVQSLVKRYVTSHMEGQVTLRYKEDQFSYQLYNFQGSFNNVEEAIVKTLQTFPQEDPMQLFDLSTNYEFLKDFKQSKAFLDKIIVVEKQWEVSKISTILREIQDVVIEKAHRRRMNQQAIYFNNNNTENNNNNNTLITLQESEGRNPSIAGSKDFKEQKKRSKFSNNDGQIDDNPNEEIAKQQKNYPLKYLKSISKQKSDRESLLSLINTILAVIDLNIEVEQYELFVSISRAQTPIEDSLMVAIKNWILLQQPSEDDVIRFKRKEPSGFQGTLIKEQILFPSLQQKHHTNLQPLAIPKRRNRFNPLDSAGNTNAINLTPLPGASSFSQLDNVQISELSIFQKDKIEDLIPSPMRESSAIPNEPKEDLMRISLGQRTDSSQSPTYPHSPTKSPTRLGSLGRSPKSSIQKDPSKNKGNDNKLKMSQKLQQIGSLPLGGLMQTWNRTVFSMSNTQSELEIINDPKLCEKLLLTNELLTASRLVHIIRNDLFRIKDFLRIKEGVAFCSEEKEMVQALQENRIPLSWWKCAFFTEENQGVSLVTFIKHVLSKLEYITTLFQTYKGGLSPIVPLTKLFDPVGFIHSMILRFSMQQNYNLLAVKVVLQKIVSMTNQKTQNNQGANATIAGISASPTSPSNNLSNSILISGLSIKNGRLNKDYFLEDDGPREFEYSLNQLQLIVTGKSEKAKGNIDQSYYDNIIPVELYDTKMNESYEFHDMESEFYNQLLFPPQVFDYNDSNSLAKDKSSVDQQQFRLSPRGSHNSNTNSLSPQALHPSQLLNPNTRHHSPTFLRTAFQKSVQSKKPVDIELTATGSTQINYAVRIPIQNPNTSQLISQFPCNFSLYLYSKKPQAYWERRGTKVIINNTI